MNNPTQRRIPSRREVREARGIEMHAPSMAIEMGDVMSDAPVWIQVAKQGSFRGHGAGAFEMTLETFGQIIANFSAQTNRHIPIDFEHASEQHPTEGSIPHSGAPAQGWIVALEIRGGNLFGLAEWGDLAKKYIRAKQYRYLSPAIVFGSKDRVTGKPVGARLSSVALTNNPFLDGMQPVAAKATSVHHTTSLEREEEPKEYDQLTALSALDDSGIPRWCGVVLEAEERVTELTAEKDELRTRLAVFEEKELHALVDSAISIWGMKRGHTSKDRDALIALARSNREAFTNLYPPQPQGAPPPPATQLVAAGAHNVPPTALVREEPMTEAKPIPVPSARELAEKAMTAAKAKGIELTLEKAFSDAHFERVALLKSGGYAK